MEGEGEGLAVFKAQVNEEIESIISKYPKPRVLVFPDYLKYFCLDLIDGAVLTKLFDNIVSLSNLRSTDKKTAVFVTPADLDTLKSVTSALQKVPNAVKVVLQIPRCTPSLEALIATNGFGIVKNNMPADPRIQVVIANFGADFDPVEPDYFLMPCVNTFKKYVVDSDFDDLFTGARALVQVQKMFGKVPHVVCVGPAAVRVRDVMNQFDNELKTMDALPQLSTLILFDRRCDMVTPLASQASVEGAIKTAFGTNYGYVDQEFVPVNEQDKFDQKGPQKLWEKLPVYPTIRVMSPLAAKNYRMFLQTKLQEQKQFLKDTHTVDEIKNNKELMKYASLTLGMYKSYGIWMNARQRLLDKMPMRDLVLNQEFELLFSQVDVVELAENLVTVYGDWKSALRLLALQSATGHGKFSWEKLQVELCMEYGLQCQDWLLDFEKAGFSSPDKFKIPLKLWGKKSSELFADFDPDTGKPMSAEGTALGGYIPRSVRIIQRIVEGDLKRIPEKVTKEIQIETTGEPPAPYPDEPEKILIFFIGGVTATEVATLRLMSREMFEGRVEFLFGSNEELTCDSFMKQFFPGVYT